MMVVMITMVVVMTTMMVMVVMVVMIMMMVMVMIVVIKSAAMLMASDRGLRIFVYVGTIRNLRNL